MFKYVYKIINKIYLFYIRCYYFILYQVMVQLFYVYQVSFLGGIDRVSRKPPRPPQPPRPSTHDPRPTNLDPRPNF